MCQMLSGEPAPETGLMFNFLNMNDSTQTVSWLKSPTVLECPSQSTVLKLTKQLWSHVRMAVHTLPIQSAEGICREEWNKLPECRCDNPVKIIQ